MSLEDLLQLADRVGIRRGALEADVRALIEERIVFWLVGKVRPRQNFLERQDVIRKRFDVLLQSRLVNDEEFERMVDSIASLQAQISRDIAPRRTGVGNVDTSTSIDLFQGQGYRCSVCGVPLRSSARHSSDRFPDGREPLRDGTIEHILPFYLVGNSTRFEYLCSDCNTLKLHRIGVHEDGFVVCGNTLNPKTSMQTQKRSIFWTCYRYRHCFEPDCPETTRTSILFASRMSKTAPFMLGNVRLGCSLHAPAASHWLHDPAMKL